MQPKTPKLLDDIRDAAAFVRQTTHGKTIDTDRTQVWQVITADLPCLEQQVAELLREDTP